MSEDYYALLDVDPEATEEAILQAYRDKAAEHHPDVSDAADAESTFQRLHEAKAVLTDEQRRREYDRMGHDQYLAQSGTDRRSEQSTPRPPSGGNQQAGVPAWPTGIGSLIQQFFGAQTAQTAPPEGRRQRAGQEAAQDPFTIDLEARLEGLIGPNRAGRAGHDSGSPAAGDPEHTECPRCRGRGRFIHEIDTARGRTRRLEPCERCGGSGTVSEPE